jgi:hypothetical protein
MTTPSDWFQGVNTTPIIPSSASSSNRGRDIASATISGAINMNKKLEPAQAANVFLSKSGPKTSERFVSILNKITPTISNEDFSLLMECAKSYSMKKDNFDIVMKRSMDLSKANLSTLGVPDDKIDNARPRQNYISQGNKLKVVLQTYFWKSDIDQNALNWGTLFQCREVIEYMQVIHSHILGVAKPQYSAGIYTNSFWSTLSFNQAYEECQFRTVLLFIFAKHCAAYIDAGMLQFDVRGNLIDENIPDVDKKQGFYNDRDKTFQSVLVSDARTKYKDFVSKAVEMTFAFKLDSCLMADAKKLMQTKDFRLSRSREMNQHREYQKLIVESMKYIIACELVITKKESEMQSIQGKLQVGDDFVKRYYQAYGYLHTVVRSCKRRLFGFTGGENTRQLDEQYVIEKEDFSSVAKKLGNKFGMSF